jgi:hypothetical protein
MFVKKLFSVVFFLALSTLIVISVFAQNYNTQVFDRVEKSANYTPPVLNRPLFAPIITSDGYDNYFLGNDFAEGHVSTNPLNPLQIFTAFNNVSNTVAIGTYYTINASNWYTNNPLFVTSQGDPCTAYDSLGNLFVENMYQPGSSITGCYVAVSSNGGVNWASPVWAVNGNDKNWIAADQTGGPYANYVYTTMTNSGTGSFARSTNHGLSFQQTYSMSYQTLPGMMVCVGPKVTGGDVPGGYVYVVTNYGNQSAPTYYFYRSADGGSTFTNVSSQQFAGYVGTLRTSGTSTRPTVEYMRTRPYPFITADNSYGTYRGRLYLVYTTNVPNQDGAKPDIFCRYSTDAGATWSSPVTVNDDPNSTNNHQWMPATWCDKETGRLYVHWFDTRNCPTSDSAEVYASYSTNGGQSFVTNQKISNSKFKIYCSSCGGGGYPTTYQGDYNAVTSNKYVSTNAWSDFRNGQFGSYTAFFPDFAMKLPSSINSIGNNDSGFVTVSVPSVKLYTEKVKFTAALETNPPSGTVTINFVNNKDSLTAYPDSVKVRIKTTGSVTPGGYILNIIGKGPNGTPVHKRSIAVNINAYAFNIGTNKNGIVTFKVNGISYTAAQSFVFNAGSTVNIAAVSPYTAGGTRYVYDHWSDNGDTTHNITVNSAMNLTAYYKTRYLLILNSAHGYTVGGGNQFYDSAVTFTFGVYPKIVYAGGGVAYKFTGWTGSGAGSYTSPDTTGIDTMVNIAISNPIIETARWVQIAVGVNNISTEVPEKFALHQNYPNPFNPTTNIKFDVAKSSLVTIKIYDVLGKEVAVLVNEVLQPGFYMVPFTANQFASGVYFCRISTDDFTDIKKIMLMK